MKKNSFHLLSVIILGMSALLSSCTLGEDETPSDNSAIGPDSRLSSIYTSALLFRQDVLNFSYDSNKRLTEIRYGNSDNEEWEIVTISYNPLKIVFEEWEKQYSYVNNQEVSEDVLSEKKEWTDITINNEGFITQVSVETRNYSDGNYSNVELEQYNLMFKYDNEGHLIKCLSNEWDSEYRWENGDLASMSYNVDDSDYGVPYTTTFKYSDVINRHGQWDPLFPMVGAIQITGWMGKAPKHYPKMATTVYQHGYSPEIIEYSYLLTDNGYIKKAAYVDNYDSIVRLNWKYTR